MARETRKARMTRIASGIVVPGDTAAAFAFVNRLRSAFGRFAALDESAPVDEATLDGLLTAKEDTQLVGDGVSVAESIVKAWVIARADAGDALYTPDDTTDTVYLGLPTHAKRFSVERKVREGVDAEGLLAALVRDGFLTVVQADTYREAFTKRTPFTAVAYKSNPTRVGA